MAFREKVRRVFHRSSSSTSNGKPKVEYYRRSEVPPSKFRGPFDKEHQKRLAAWSFEGAMADRPRSPNLSLSPCATYDLPPSSLDTGDVSPDDDGVGNDPGMRLLREPSRIFPNLRSPFRLCLTYRYRLLPPHQHGISVVHCRQLRELQWLYDDSSRRAFHL